MNIDENTSSLSEIDEMLNKVCSFLTEVSVPILHLSSTIHCPMCYQLYDSLCWLSKFFYLLIHEY